MIGLIDCNNFFVSCERVFNPALRDRPVVVLSNNDGCAVAISNEAKKIGIKRGIPFFRMKDVAERHDIAVLSGNHRLYGDMSSRVMATISEVIPEIEVYSVDECFIRFDKWPVADVDFAGHEIVRKVRRNTGIPTSLGIAPTKTLAKIASKFAKKFPAYNSVCKIDSEEKRRKALALTPVEDIWGIGRRLSRKMHSLGVDTALQLAELSRERIRSIVNVTGERTWRELRGEPCIDFEIVAPDKKQICCSRSFGNMIFEFEPLSEAVAAFAAIASRKLREQNSAAAGVSVFVHTNPHREDMDQYYGTNFIPLEESSNDVMTITAAAIQALRPIYRTGYGFKKAGIIITDIVSLDRVQPSLFTNAEERCRRQRLMYVMDYINADSLVRDMVHLASRSPLESHVRRQYASRQYSTRMSDIITVHTPHKNLHINYSNNPVCSHNHNSSNLQPASKPLKIYG